MAFNWRREPSNPYLPADGSMAQMAANSMAGYKPLTAMTPQGNGMNGYFSNDAVANQSQGFSVPNQQHGGMGQPELDGYGASLQAASDAAAQAQAREQQIANIQSQIKALQTSIAEKQAKLKNWNNDDVANKVAALEARKFFSKDPTSIWRWKIGQDATKQQRAEDLARVEAEKQKNKDEQKQFIRNKISSTLPTMSIGWNTSPEQIQQYKNTLASLKTEAMNNQLKDEMNNILDVEAQLNGELPRQRAQIAMNKMKNAEKLFNATKDDGGFGKDPKEYHNYLLQQFTQITRDYPEAAYDPAFIEAFEEADAKFKKQVKTPKVKAPGRR